jgi:hypothetical protein
MSQQIDFILSIILAIIGLLSIVAIVLLYSYNAITNEKEKGLIYFLFGLLSVISYGFSYTKYKSSRSFPICVTNDTFSDIVESAIAENNKTKLEELEKNKNVIAYQKMLKYLHPERYPRG